MPFEVPESWEWVTVGDIFTHNTGKALNSSNSQGEIMSYITTSNLYWNRFDLSVIKEMPFTESEVVKCTVTRGDLLVCEGGDIGRAAIWNYDFDIRIQNHIHRLRSIIQLNHLFYYHVFYLFKSLNLIGGKGVAIQGLSSSDLAKLLVPLPPISEQNRIVSELNRWLSVVDQIELDQYSLKNTIADIKNRILCLAISGKLVGQDISDEPAIELLKKINPSYISCDNRHYRNVPEGWAVCTFEDILEYEQPQQYIVNSTDYSDEYEIPVLTAGKSFIIGKTNEKSGVCKRLPVIIFDDFTTDSKYVDFPFKVKSSAIKILHAKGNVNPQYIAYLMSVTRLIGDTHKRYWISEYSKIPIMLPPVNEQEKIVSEIEKIYEGLNKILAEL